MSERYKIEKVTNRNRTGFNAHIVGECGPVAEVYGWEDEDNQQRACLFAAAPELLEACQDVFDAIEDEYNDRTMTLVGDCGPLLIKLKSAIAKATSKAVGHA